MTPSTKRIIVALGAIALLSTPVIADQWNDRISLTFSAPVMVLDGDAGQR